MTKTLFLNDFGILPNTGNECSLVLQKVFDILPDGAAL